MMTSIKSPLVSLLIIFLSIVTFASAQEHEHEHPFLGFQGTILCKSRNWAGIEGVKPLVKCQNVSDVSDVHMVREVRLETTVTDSNGYFHIEPIQLPHDLEAADCKLFHNPKAFTSSCNIPVNVDVNGFPPTFEKEIHDYKEQYDLHLYSYKTALVYKEL